MAERLIGTGTTNANGVASVTYRGNGRGKIDIIAKSGRIQSEIYDVWDTIFYTDCTTDTSNWEVDNSATTTYDENGLTVSGGGLLRLKVNSNTHYFDGTQNLIVEFDFKTDNACMWYVINNSGGRGTGIHNFASALSDFKHIKWVYNATAHTFTPYIDGEAQTSVDVSSQTLTTLGFQITDWQSDLSVHIKNFMVYYA